MEYTVAGQGGRECIKFPECLASGCDKVMRLQWEVTGAWVRVCQVYASPSYWFKRDGCPIVYKHIEGPEKKRWGHEKKRGNR